MHRIQDFAKKTNQKLTAHFKENEQLIHEVNSLHMEHKHNSKLMKKCVTLKRSQVERCSSLHQL